MEITQLGAAAQRQAAALDNLAIAAGESGDEITSAIREASDFTIDRMTAMEAANKAMIMQVADSPEEFERLARVATGLGRAMGQDAAKSIDDFVVAAARQSKQIADNLGLVVSAEDAYKRYADANNIAVDEMDDAAKKQAFLTEMLRQGEAAMADLGDAALDNAAKIEQAKSTWQTFISIAGEGFADALLGGVGSLEGFNRAMDEHGDKLREGMTYVIQQYTGLNKLTDAINAVRTALGMNEPALVSAAEGQRYLSGEIERTIPALEKVNPLTFEARQYLADLAHEEQIVGETIRTTASGIDFAAEQWNKLAQAEREATIATEEAKTAQLGLAASLKDATDAQIAQAAISQLGVALAEGDITLEQYNTAVGQVQMTFGLATEESMRLSEGIFGLTTNLSDGTLSAEGYDEALLGLIGTTTDAATRTSDLAAELAALPEKKTVTVEYRRVTTGSAPSGDDNIPELQHGGYSMGGLALVGERGPELVSLPRGARVYSTGQSQQMMGSVNIGPVYITGESPEVIWRKLENYARLKGKSGWQQLGR